MGAVLGILSLVLLLLQLLLIARMVLDWSAVLAGPSPSGSIRTRLSTVIRALTEPILAPVRRLIPPIRVGGIAIDLAFLVVFIAIVFIRGLLT
jgi:YggT family protein